MTTLQLIQLIKWFKQMRLVMIYFLTKLEIRISYKNIINIVFHFLKLKTFGF